MNELELYQYIGHRLPRAPHVSGIINRILKPIYNRKNRGLVVSDVFDFKMELDPRECVDGNLLFCPQLYDYKEMMFMDKNLKGDDVFVDIGSHIGFYSLMASRKCKTVVAIEANPETFQRLRKNIQLNHAAISAIHSGVSDKKELLRLSPNTGTNAGEMSFMGNCENGIEVQCVPLIDILEQQHIKAIKMLKIDVEGYEYKILNHFYNHADKSLFPQLLITEFYENNVHNTTGNQIQLLEKYGYKEIFRSHDNRIFQAASSY
ncbi:MAG: FkbM family methyltransferase [Desulfobacterales bacterium]